MQVTCNTSYAMWHFDMGAFLALLCATAQQSYCRHTGVRRPSVRKTRFLRTRQVY